MFVYPIHTADFDIEKSVVELEHVQPEKRKVLLSSGKFNASYRDAMAFADDTYQIYDSINDHPRLVRIPPEKLFCNTNKFGYCKIFDKEASLHNNFSHLSYFGACQLITEIF